MRTLDSNNLVLYLKQNNDLHDIQKLLNWGIEIMNSYNFTPNYIGISGGNYPDNLVKIKTGITKLTKNNFQDVTSFELYFSETDSPSYDWELCFILKIKDSVEIYIGGNNELISLASIIQRLDEFLSQFSYESIYGYFFSRPYNLGPEFYPFGVGYGDISDEELSKCTLWRNDLYGNIQFFNGKIRELYTLNILHENHLNFKMNNGKLFIEFIKKNKLNLQKVKNETYLLYVNEVDLLNRLLVDLGIKTY
jgi:hypothetical protein